jgi:hypothetical protein
VSFKHYSEHPFSNIFSLCSSRGTSGQFPHLYKSTVRIVIYFILFFTLLDRIRGGKDSVNFIFTNAMVYYA